MNKYKKKRQTGAGVIHTPAPGKYKKNYLTTNSTCPFRSDGLITK